MSDRQLALSLGARAERAMRYADELRVAPGPYALNEILQALDQATQADPSLADPWWDLAVIAARFAGDYDTASRHLATALDLGYQHPMRAALQALIEKRPPIAPPPADAGTLLLRLFLDLAVQAESPAESLLHDEAAALPDDGSAPPRPATFGAHVSEARVLCRAGAASEETAAAMLAFAKLLPGDTREYVLDLLRRIAPDFRHADFAKSATEAHLYTLRDMAFATFAPKPAAARRSRRAAERGLVAVAEAPWLEGSDLHADLLIARGQGLYYEGTGREAEAIRCYRDALRAKRRAGNTADAARLVELLRKQIEHGINRSALGGFIGIEAGRTVEHLRVCIDVATDIDDGHGAAASRLALADLLHGLGRRQESEQVLKDLLATDASPAVRWGARFTLASLYAETARPRQAAELQEALLQEAGDRSAREQSVLWSNYANSLRLCGDLDRAWAALEKSWDLLPADVKAPPPGRVSSEFIRMKLLFAQLAKERGDLRGALAYLDEEAQAAGGSWDFGLGQARSAELRADVLLAAHSYDEAAATLDVAAQNLRSVLVKGQNFETWEGLFQRWSSLDAMAVQAHARRTGEGGVRDALLCAEGAKGRVLSWLATRDPAAAARVLDPERQRAALARARAWVRPGTRRRVVSLFASRRGSGVFSLRSDAEVEGAWLEDVDYDRLLDNAYLPFAHAVDEALSRGEMPLVRTSSALLEHLLALVGTWLWRAVPELAEGGSELILVPHRLLRALPLAHAMLPTGRRLSDLFESVWTAPSLDLAFADADPDGEHAAGREGELQAVVDPDDTLAFAAGEALASADPARVRRGTSATAAALASVLGGDDIALVSMHGTFDPSDPFSHRVFAADRAVELRELVLQDTPVRAPIIFLGVCEAGLQRRSVSDEPIGFPTMLVQAGAQAVVAPLWNVDDFASLHFMTRCLAEVKRGAPVARAALASAHWMRSAAPKDVIGATDAVVAAIQARLAPDDPLLERIGNRCAQQRRWLDGLAHDARPFDSAIDWAAFQVTQRARIPPATEA